MKITAISFKTLMETRPLSMLRVLMTLELFLAHKTSYRELKNAMRELTSKRYRRTGDGVVASEAFVLSLAGAKKDGKFITISNCNSHSGTVWELIDE